MNEELPMANCQSPIERRCGFLFSNSIGNRKSKIENGFTLIEVMVVVALLSLIVLALMAVFDATQKAFRASITQTDILEGGRAAMDLMANDIRLAARADDGSGVNFYVTSNANYEPLVQPLPTDSQHFLTNVLENVFILHRENLTWTGVGYAVAPTNLGGSFAGNLYSLYRFSMSTNVSAGSPLALYSQFTNDIYFNNRTNGLWSHLMDGVVNLTVRAYDTSGAWMTTTNIIVKNGVTGFVPRYTQFYFCLTNLGEVGFCMTNTALPATVEIQMNVLEDRVLQHAESLNNPGQSPWNNLIQGIYLTNAIGQVHVFRQRVMVQNVDSSVYQ